MTGRPIAFMTDLGVGDDAVGMCKGLMLRISPDSQIVDITHGVRPFDVRQAGHYLGDLPRYFPDDTVFCCFVFPQTGTVPTIAVRNDRGQIFVAPDNGILTLAIGASGLAEAYDVENRDVMEYPPTPSFHGRDIMATCAAHLAAGAALEIVGPPRASIALLEYRDARITGDGAVKGEVTVIDKNFGNVWSNITQELLAEAGVDSSGSIEVTIGDERVTYSLVQTFGDVPFGEPLAYFNSRGRLALALNRGNLAETLGPVEGRELTVRMADETLERHDEPADAVALARQAKLAGTG
jgi:S-adenosylmethionine hydrolase